MPRRTTPRRSSSRGTPRRWRARWPTRCPRGTASMSSRRGWRTCGRAPASAWRRSSPTSSPSSTRSRPPCPTTPPWCATCASPATGSAAFIPFPRRGGSRTRWDGGRWAGRFRRRSGRRWAVQARPSPSAGTAASSSRAASWPRWRRSARRSPRWSSTTAATGCCATTTSGRGRGRSESTSTRRTSSRWRRASAWGPKPSTAWETRSPPRSRATSPIPSPASSWRAPRSSRRPRRRRAGTGAA